jgi:hypothetical protein
MAKGLKQILDQWEKDYTVPNPWSMAKELKQILTNGKKD